MSDQFSSDPFEIQESPNRANITIDDTDPFAIQPSPYTNINDLDFETGLLDGSAPPLTISRGVEGEDFFYNSEQLTDNNQIRQRGFVDGGDFWIKSKNGTDDVIEDGQRIAYVAGTADIITGNQVSDFDIRIGLAEGSLVASDSFVSYDGIDVIANFEAGSLDSLFATGEQIYVTRIDAETGEQLGNALAIDQTQTFDNFDSVYDSSLSSSNNNNYGSFLEVINSTPREIPPTTSSSDLLFVGDTTESSGTIIFADADGFNENMITDANFSAGLIW